MRSSDSLPRSVLTRIAVVYIRQSTPVQVRDNLESQRRQYDLVEVARRHGFARVDVIDDDLGLSASGAVARPGFDRLVARLCAGEIGAVLCFEASRIARNGRDWHHILELCGLVEARVIDQDSIYDPRHPNDRLLLGMLCGSRHNMPYVGQPAMSGSVHNPLSIRDFSPDCPT